MDAIIQRAFWCDWPVPVPDRRKMRLKIPILGQEAIVHTYGLGRVTEIGSDYIGVTPYVAGYQMKFRPSNVQLVKVVMNDSGE